MISDPLLPDFLPIRRVATKMAHGLALLRIGITPCAARYAIASWQPLVSRHQQIDHRTIKFERPYAGLLKEYLLLVQGRQGSQQQILSFFTL